MIKYVILLLLEKNKNTPADAGADTSILEGEIDVVVYGLYGLGAEEIGIIEGK
jgi:hypothetical protein